MEFEITYSIVIPVYNAEESLQELTDRIRKVMDEIGSPYEVILVDDCSSDKSWTKLQEIHDKDKRFKAIQLFRNFGQHNGTLCGLAHSSGQYVLTLDCDLEHHPEDIPKLLEYKEHDIVIAKFETKTHNLFKRIASRIKDGYIQKLIGSPKRFYISSFRLFQNQVVKNMVKIATPYPYIPAMMFFVSKDAVNVSIEHGVRKYGKSTYSLRAMIRLFSYLMINNSSYLLRVIGKSGLMVAGIGLLMGFYFIVRKFFIPTVVPGWTTLVVLNLVIGGLILIGQSVTGEYLIRIINSSEERPSYIERNILK